MTMILYGDENGEFEVHVLDKYILTSRRPDGTMEFVKRSFKYVVNIKPDNTVTYTCQGIQLAHIVLMLLRCVE